MAKRGGISLPSGQGGLVAGLSTSYKSKIEFSPKFVVVFAIAIVVFVFLLHRVNG
jgi:preprotein translocase subunit Sec61beta